MMVFREATRDDSRRRVTVASVWIKQKVDVSPENLCFIGIETLLEQPTAEVTMMV